jgi:hypothetical protein
MEIDLVALTATDRIIRLGFCKRSPAELVRDLPVFGGHVERFHLPRKNARHGYGNGVH